MIRMVLPDEGPGKGPVWFIGTPEQVADLMVLGAKFLAEEDACGYPGGAATGTLMEISEMWARVFEAVDKKVVQPEDILRLGEIVFSCARCPKCSEGRGVVCDGDDGTALQVQRYRCNACSHRFRDNLSPRNAKRIHPEAYRTLLQYNEGRLRTDLAAENATRCQRLLDALPQAPEALIATLKSVPDPAPWKANGRPPIPTWLKAYCALLYVNSGAGSRAAYNVWAAAAQNGVIPVAPAFNVVTRFLRAPTTAAYLDSAHAHAQSTKVPA